MLDTPTRLGSEYQLLATLSADISEAKSFDNGQLPENRRKNRYINILPCKYAENLGWVLFRHSDRKKQQLRERIGEEKKQRSRVSSDLMTSLNLILNA
jgi:hypothetical protein